MESSKNLLKRKACCFTGHRSFMKDKNEINLARLNSEIDRLIELGVSVFYSGGALGFDQVSASIIIKKRDEGKNIELIFALPYKNQDELWNQTQKIFYRNLLNKGNEIVYVSNTFSKDCMHQHILTA